MTLPPRAAYVRVVLLELERIYNHIADVGAIYADTGFAVANAHTIRLREELLRLYARLTGHRLLRGMVTTGGIARDVSADQLTNVLTTLRRVLTDFDEVVDVATHNGMVLDRLHATGRLTIRPAREMQVVGIAARASGVNADARRDHPFAAYTLVPPRVVVYTQGDVWARMMVRVEEAREAGRLIRVAIETLPNTESRCADANAPAGRECVRFGGRMARTDLALGGRRRKQQVDTRQGQRPIIRQLGLRSITRF